MIDFAVDSLGRHLRQDPAEGPPERVAGYIAAMKAHDEYQEHELERQIEAERARTRREPEDADED